MSTAFQVYDVERLVVVSSTTIKDLNNKPRAQFVILRIECPHEEHSIYLTFNDHNKGISFVEALQPKEQPSEKETVPHIVDESDTFTDNSRRSQE